MSVWASIILAGGESRRMGQSKGLLPVKGEPLLKKLVGVVQPFSEHIIVVAREEEKKEIRRSLPQLNNLVVITDEPRFKGKGPLAGMQAGMSLRLADYYFVCACDLPCLDQSFIAGLKSCVAENGGYAAYIPVEAERYQPLAAVYQPIQSIIESLLRQNELKWTALLNRLSTYYLIEEREWRGWSEVSNPFFNMNTPDDYNKIRSGCV